MGCRLGDYDHLNTSPLAIPVTMPQLVTLVMQENYGVHRFLSELVRQRKAQHAADITRYRARGDDDIAEAVETSERVQLTNAIERLLNDGAD